MEKFINSIKTILIGSIFVNQGKGTSIVILLTVGYVSAVHFNACNKCFGTSPYRTPFTDQLIVSRHSVPQHMREFLSNLLDLKSEVSRETTRFELTYHDGDASFLDLMTIREQPSCLARHRHITDPRMLFFEELSNLSLYLDFMQTNGLRNACDVHTTRLCANDLLCKWRQVLSGLRLFDRYPRPCCRRSFPDNRITSCTHLRAVVYLTLRQSREIITYLESRARNFIEDLEEYE